MNISNFKNVYILAPHTDDGELGAGGTISKLIESGSNVYYFAFSTASKSVPKGYAKDILKTEVINSTSVLGIPRKNLYIYNYEVRRLKESRQEILEDLIEKRKICNPDLVLLPSLNDIHQDHQTIAREGVRAFKKTSILGYELIWNNLSFNTTAMVEISKDQLDKKIKSLSEYKSQSSREYMNREFIKSLARVRGVQFGSKYAECFEVIRWIIK